MGPAYPQDADQEVRKWAEKAKMPNVIDILNQIRDLLFGNANRVLEMSEEWARDDSLIKTSDSIQTASNGLKGMWEGAAADAYQAYASQTSNALSADDQVFDTISRGLNECARAVIDTYKIAIGFIGSTAANLSKISIDVPLLFIPGVDLIELSSVVDDAKEILAGFIRDVGDALNKALTVVQQYIKDANSFDTAAGNFHLPPEPTPGAAVVGNWHVHKVN